LRRQHFVPSNCTESIVLYHLKGFAKRALSNENNLRRFLLREKEASLETRSFSYFLQKAAIYPSQL
jgi:hypothetical protein